MMSCLFISIRLIGVAATILSGNTFQHNVNTNTISQEKSSSGNTYKYSIHTAFQCIDQCTFSIINFILCQYIVVVKSVHRKSKFILFMQHNAVPDNLSAAFCPGLTNCRQCFGQQKPTLQFLIISFSETESSASSKLLQDICTSAMTSTNMHCISVIRTNNHHKSKEWESPDEEYL